MGRGKEKDDEEEDKIKETGWRELKRELRVKRRTTRGFIRSKFRYLYTQQPARARAAVWCASYRSTDRRRDSPKTGGRGRREGTAGGACDCQCQYVRATKGTYQIDKTIDWVWGLACEHE